MKKNSSQFLSRILTMIFVSATAFSTSVVNGATPDDSYIAGNAAEVLKHSLNINILSLAVRNGIVSVPASDLPQANRTRVVQVLSEIAGFTAVTSSGNHRCADRNCSAARRM